MTWITLPSVSVQNGSKIVTVNNTQTTNIKVGDALLIGNYQPVEIAGVFATQLSLRTNWSNAAQANASAVVLPTFGDFNAATQALRQATQVTQGNFKTLENWGTKLGNITFEGQDNSKHTARTFLQMDADVSELEEQANNLIVSLSGRNFALSKAIVDVLRSGNKEQYAASGFIHDGKAYVPSNVTIAINEGMWTYAIPQALLTNSFAMGNMAGSQVGTSATPHPVMNVAGFEVHLRGINTDNTALCNKIILPESPNGTVVSDSSGNCRGTGKPTLDLSKEVDPKYGDVADSVNEAVARAFEGSVKNGDLRDGVAHWASYQGSTSVIEGGVLKGTAGSNSNICLYQSGSVYEVGKKYKVSLKNVTSNQTFSVRIAGRYISSEVIPACTNKDLDLIVTTDLKGTGLYIAGSGIGAVISIGGISIAPTTEEVVTERVDMAGLEFFKEKVGAYLYPYGMIQNKATADGGIATTEDTVRPITYFAVFDGDTTSRGRGWKLADLTFVQLATIMSNPEHNAWYNEAGELMQFRGRQRSFTGLGNGDWRVINPKGDILSFGTENLTRVAAQGRLDTPASPSSGGSFFAGYTFTAHNAKPEVGMFTVSSNSGDYQAPDGECYFYVLTTVPRLNQGAYHLSFNPMGTKLHDSTRGIGFAENWYATNAVDLKTTEDAFKVANTSGAIGQSSGRPDGRFYDAIYASGQGGVIDWRLPARDMSGEEEAAKIFQKVVNGTYRGIEKLVWSKAVNYGTPLAVNVTSGQTFIQGGEPSNYSQLPVVGSVSKSEIHGHYLAADGKIYNLNARHATGNYVYLTDTEGDLRGKIPTTGTHYLVTTTKTNISVSGDFTTLDVIGPPEGIFATPALANGWVGRWIPDWEPTTPSQPMTRKWLSGNIAKTHTSDLGGSWSNTANTGGDDVTNKANTYQNSNHDLVQILHYKIFAKQTKGSVNKSVLNGSEGVGDVYAMDRYTTFNGASFVESLIGKVPTSASQRTYAELMLQEATKTNESKLAFVTHTALTLDTPTNNSPAVKTLWHQASNNRQATLNFLWNEMVFDTNWRTPDKVWSGGSVSVAAGETFRAESSSAYAVAGLLMRCVKAVTANATVLGAMHVSVGGEVISLTDGQTYFKVVNNGWSDDSTIRIIDGVGTFNNENGDACLYGTDELAMSYGYTKNQAGAGKQVVGVDL
ncbi:hypothetical protein ABRZ83_18125 [Vibrio vulnificus]|uniref:hypothetical protein n=1 Tax=Vibrio vulnificus TaxID=672 RepID=UPI0028CCF98C|nr:hypothetical protein [Vibrio vulnificus]